MDVVDPVEPRPGTPRDEAIPVLLERHGGRLLALGTRFCGSAEEAEDLVQETLLQAYNSWDRFEGRSSPATWLYTIASRVCQRFHRKRSGEPEEVVSLDEELPFGASRAARVATPDPGPLEEGLRREGERRVGEAIAVLPLEFRMPLVLKEIVGFSVAEVAGMLGLKPATVKTRLHRARLRLRDALDEVLPRRELPPAAYSEQVCLDLLRAKQESLDRGTAFPETGDEVTCERCRAVFRSLDLASDLCAGLGRGELPPTLRRRLLDRLEEA